MGPPLLSGFLKGGTKRQFIEEQVHSKGAGAGSSAERGSWAPLTFRFLLTALQTEGHQPWALLQMSLPLSRTACVPGHAPTPANGAQWSGGGSPGAAPAWPRPVGRRRPGPAGSALGAGCLAHPAKLRAGTELDVRGSGRGAPGTERLQLLGMGRRLGCLLGAPWPGVLGTRPGAPWDSAGRCGDAAASAPAEVRGDRGPVAGVRGRDPGSAYWGMMDPLTPVGH